MARQLVGCSADEIEQELKQAYTQGVLRGLSQARIENSKGIKRLEDRVREEDQRWIGWPGDREPEPHQRRFPPGV